MVMESDTYTCLDGSRLGDWKSRKVVSLCCWEAADSISAFVADRFLLEAGLN